MFHFLVHRGAQSRLQLGTAALNRCPKTTPTNLCKLFNRVFNTTPCKLSGCKLYLGCRIDRAVQQVVQERNVSPSSYPAGAGREAIPFPLPGRRAGIIFSDHNNSKGDTAKIQPRDVRSILQSLLLPPKKSKKIAGLDGRLCVDVVLSHRRPRQLSPASLHHRPRHFSTSIAPK